MGLAHGFFDQKVEFKVLQAFLLQVSFRMPPQQDQEESKGMNFEENLEKFFSSFRGTITWRTAACFNTSEFLSASLSSESISCTNSIYPMRKTD